MTSSVVRYFVTLLSTLTFLLMEEFYLLLLILLRKLHKKNQTIPLKFQYVSSLSTCQAIHAPVTATVRAAEAMEIVAAATTTAVGATTGTAMAVMAAAAEVATAVPSVKFAATTVTPLSSVANT